MVIGKVRINDVTNFVYILQSEKNGRYYVGSTSNIDRRMLEHNNGKTKSLYYLRPLKLVFKQSFATIQKARQMEIKLKKNKSRVIIEKVIRDGEIKMGL